jgi:ABC-2 type transport system ATP-binding protein
VTQGKVVARGLTKRYGTLTAVENLNLEVGAGETFGLLGPNGAGKTTALEMMERLRTPDSGTCTICGFDDQGQASQVREIIGVQLQASNLMEDVTVKELIELYRSFYARPVPAGDLLSQFQLGEKAGSAVSKLSGGQKQRLVLALALVNDPEVVFLDEPTTGLDPQARRSLWDSINGLRGRGRSIILSTHYMEEAEYLCDRVAIMDHGRILAQGSPRTLIRQHGPESAIEFSAVPGRLDPAALAGLRAVTGVKCQEDHSILFTASTTATLIDLAAHVQLQGLELNDLRTRVGTLEDVFISLTGRRLRA